MLSKVPSLKMSWTLKVPLNVFYITVGLASKQTSSTKFRAKFPESHGGTKPWQSPSNPNAATWKTKC